MSRISIVTPTLHRCDEVRALLENLCSQTLTPYELILVDGAPKDTSTENLIAEQAGRLPYKVRYIRHGGGTAIQRNKGIDAASGDFISFIDDDIRLEPDFLQQMMEVFTKDLDRQVGGISGYITNQYFDMKTSPRWNWYRRLGLFTTYEPGSYDFKTGYPINRYGQPPYDGVREIDCMGAGCAIWRREVFENGIRFDEFFSGFGVLEDAHLALRAGREWTLLESGSARCVHLHSSSSRENPRVVARKTAVNYRYVFVDIVPYRTLVNELRFWRVQAFDLFRVTVHAIRTQQKSDWLFVLGKIEGIGASLLGTYRKHGARAA